VPPLELTPSAVEEVLTHGTVEIVGRMRYSSNAALMVEVRAGGDCVPAVYKPQRGERPLWDFPDGSLCRREVAAYELSRALGWGIVPVTVLREDAPAGPGAFQRFVEHDPEDHYFTLLEGRHDRFRRFAAFDVVANNTDRKGGHCLLDHADREVVGIDHGLTFHEVWKLRTVIWDFAGEPVPEPMIDDLRRVGAELGGGSLGRCLAALLDPDEVVATADRARELVDEGSFPLPDLGYRSMPWPLV
jgi:uncharacterized repeat protein (TIGR03843 family)